MKRIVASLLAGSALIAGIVVLVGAGGGPGAPHYWITMDNAFGLIPGGDVKIAGVRAGHIASFTVDRQTYKALVQIDITTPGFSLRRDAYCETRPQSLIGEYFLDCRPGTSPYPLPNGGRLPVTQSGSTVPLDLINAILRVPYRQRLALFLDGIGAGVGGRGADIAATIRRAVPALREFDQVLAILAQQNHTVADLDQNADTVITTLAQNRRDLARWVVQSGRAAHASAVEHIALAQTFNRFPAFLEQLTPTMRSLGRSVEHQTPALRNLNDNAGQLTRLFSDLGPFANASLPAVQSLGRLARVGREAVPAATPVVALLRRIGVPLPEVARDEAISLHDLDDRSRATEPDPRSPGGKGFTGLEALLEYARNQSLGLNAFDQFGYVLRASIFLSSCGRYTDAQSAKANPAEIKQCASYLGPNQPGVTTPDPTLPAGQTSAADSASPRSSRSMTPTETGKRAPRAAPHTTLSGASPASPAASLNALLGGSGGATAGKSPDGSSASAIQSLVRYLVAP